MSFIELSYDESKKLFAVPVILSRVKHLSGIKNQPISKQKLMYLDTGSSRTSIVDIDAIELEIDVESLPREDVGGIGGVTPLPVSNDVTVTVLDSQNNPINLKMEKVAIFPSTVKRKIRRNNGVFKERGYVQGKMFDLLGLDALEQLKGELIINMEKKKGRIELSQEKQTIVAQKY